MSAHTDSLFEALLNIICRQHCSQNQQRELGHSYIVMPHTTLAICMNVMHVDMIDDHLRKPLPKKHAPHHIDDCACHHMRSAAFWNLQPMHLDQI